MRQTSDFFLYAALIPWDTMLRIIPIKIRMLFGVLMERLIVLLRAIFILISMVILTDAHALQELDSVPSNCSFIGNVFGNANNKNTELAVEKAKGEARIKAVEISATHIFWTTTIIEGQKADVAAKTYKCIETSQQVNEPPANQLSNKSPNLKDEYPRLWGDAKEGKISFTEAHRQLDAIRQVQNPKDRYLKEYLTDIGDAARMIDAKAWSIERAESILAGQYAALNKKAREDARHSNLYSGNEEYRNAVKAMSSNEQDPYTADERQQQAEAYNNFKAKRQETAESDRITNALQAVAAGLQMMQPRQVAPLPTFNPPPVNCTSRAWGNQVITNCR